MTLEEQFEILRQNGWRWRQIDDDWVEIEAPAERAGEQTLIYSLLATAQSFHSPFFCDLPLIAQDEPHALAGHLLAYSTRHELSQNELAEHLDCSVEALRELAYQPIPQPETLETDLQQASRESGCNVAALRRVIDEQKRPPIEWLIEGGEP